MTKPTWKQAGLLAIIVLGVVYFVSMVAIPLTVGDWKYVQKVWDRWQSLNVGVLALVAAGLALESSRQQMRLARKLAEEARDAQYRGVLATLPFALSAIVDYAADCIKVAREIRDHLVKEGDGPPIDPPNISMPQIDPAIISILRETIEFAKDDVTARPFARILNWHQIQTSRLRDLVTSVLQPKVGNVIRVCIPEHADGKIADATILYVLAEQMFSYARQVDQELPKTLEIEHLSRALHACHVSEVFYPEAHQVLEGHRESYLKKLWPEGLEDNDAGSQN